MRTHPWISLVLWVVGCNLAGLIGAAATFKAGAYYRTLVRPSWAPPSWIFGPVWTFLYILMGIAAWMVWKADPSTPARGIALGLFVAQLALNALWSWIFFAWKNGAFAFGEIIVLALLIALTISAFARVDRGAALLLVPYLCWVVFATCLTFSIWTRNPERL